MEEFRAWKWMVPGAGFAGLFMTILFLRDIGTSLAMYCGGGVVIVMVILAAQTAAGFRAYYRQVDVDQLTARRRALADTAEVRLFEASQGMHPEALRLLLKHRLEVWRIKEMPSQDLLLPVLDADPRITLPFMEYVLRHSNPFSIMPKRMLNDKAHSFDPRRVVTDYEQYDALHKLLEGRMWLTAGFGNQPGQWIEPWNPELLARRFGISLSDEEGEEDREKLEVVGEQ